MARQKIRGKQGRTMPPHAHNRPVKFGHILDRVRRLSGFQPEALAGFRQGARFGLDPRIARGHQLAGNARIRNGLKFSYNGVQNFAPCLRSTLIKHLFTLFCIGNQVASVFTSGTHLIPSVPTATRGFGFIPGGLHFRSLAEPRWSRDRIWEVAGATG
jgi:hypothetical protein